ncbi:MAG: tetratricopeptide repeat-containing glycosyltransferase family protein [Pseudomonadota bacterium]
MNDMSNEPKPKTVQEAFQSAIEAHKNDDLDRAAQLYRLCLMNRPNMSVVWTNYGSLLRKKQRYREAIACHRKALQLDSASVNARSNLANALADFGIAAEAVEIREKLVEEFPDDWSRIRDLAIAYRGSRRNQEAVDLIDDAEARLGHSESAQLQRALAHLMLGNYAEGFADFEARYSGDEVSLPKDAPWPRWMGEPVEGKRVLVLPEQGFGDAILMARFLPQLKAMGAEVSMVVKPPLMRLFAEIEGVDHILKGASKSEHYDYYTPNMSLPHLVGLKNNRPPPLPRLTIPDDSRKRAKGITAAHRDSFKIGIVWTGSLTYRANHRRSTGPDSFLGLAMVPGVQLFSLYKGDAHRDFVDSGMSGLVLDACGKDRDFADTAALIEEMDLLITTDTAVVHVGASLGKPVWNLLTWEGFWLYGSEDTTLWYPSMRLFRQQRTGDWESLFTRVEEELRLHLDARA